MVVAEEHGIGTTIQHTLEQRSLEAQLRQHILLNGAGGNEVDDLHSMLLTDTVNTADALLQHGWIPGYIEVNDHAGGLQVQTHAARIGTEEHTHTGRRAESLHTFLTLARRNIAMQVGVLHPASLQFLRHQTCHALPLAEDDHFLRTVAGNHASLVEDVHHLLHLRVRTAALIEHKEAVACHSHLRERQQQLLAIHLREEVHTVPFGHETSRLHLQFIVGIQLFLRHRHEQILVDARR